MKKPIFTGSAVAIITPFTESGVDFEKLEELIEFQIKENTDALVICGTTGEASTMPDEEHKEVIKFAVEKVNKRIPVIAGTGSNDTKHAVALTQYAESVGADADRKSTRLNSSHPSISYAVFCLKKKIAESVKIPVMLYNVPSRTNLNIDPQTVKALSEIENITAIKECNLNQVGEIINLCGDDITVYSGNDDQILPLLALGGKGVVSVLANILPKETHNLVASFLAGDIAESRRIQLKYLDLIKALFVEVSPIPVKAAMNLMGMNVGNCRLPLVEMSEKNLNYLKDTLKKYGLIN